MEPSGARYSYVSAPPKGAGVKVIDPVGEFKPDASLRPAACKALRRELYAFGVQGCFVVGVSSVVDASERKPRFAAELALSLAETGHARVLLLNVDASHPTAHSLLGVSFPEGASLSEQLDRQSTLEVESPWEVVQCSKSLHALGGGSLPPAGPLGRAFERCMHSMRGSYDFVVVHGPNLSDETACTLLAHSVDGALAVSFTADASIGRALAPFLNKRLARIVLSARETDPPTN
jgi:Mrp family chromosome partitioning ATPase